MIAEADKWRKRYEREKSARLQAEALLEEKSSQLFEANDQLEKKITLKSSKLKREEKKFTALFHSSTDGILLYTPDGIILDANQTICNLLELNAKELIGTHIIKVYTDDSQVKAKKAIDEVNKLGQTRFECLFKGANKKQTPVEVSATKFEVDDQTVLQAIIRDITERIRIANDLKKATKEAIDANEAKSLFLATMSHEIRTPLNGIIGFTDILLQDSTSAEQKQHLNIIKTSGDMLLHIINDILDFSRIENHQIELESVDYSLIDCIEETLDIQAHSAADKAVDLLYTVANDTPLYLHGDSGRLRQILLNLVSNGLKFTKAGNVVIHITHPDQYTIQITVTDTGIGFDPTIAEQLFQPFKQADASTTRKYGGSGLGLAICRQLIETMGGNIQATSTLGKGAQFTIRFPYTPAKQLCSSLEETYDLAKLKTIHALVIDDHQMNLEFLKIRLRKWGCQVTTATSGKIALEIIRAAETEFHIILTDMLMPEMDGLQLGEVIIAHGGEKTPPLILVTSSRQNTEKRKALKIGFKGLIHKPIREKELLTNLFKAIYTEEAPKPALIPEPLPQSMVGKNYVLIVEDNSINAKLARLLVERFGFTAHIAYNGKEAITSLKNKEIYGIILMDMQMPVMDGLEASRRIRLGEAGKTYSKIPIIAMTANAQPEDKKRCFEAGMDQYLSKPINAAALEATLKLYFKV
ncbi:MAG: response regulator [Akkermansiaceae bacterium]